MAPGVRWERAAMLLFLSAAALACLLGVIARPSAVPQGGLSHQTADLIRVTCTAALVVVLLLGPGIVLRSIGGGRRIGLGFLPLPGIALLVCTGALAWALAKPVGAHVASFAVTVPVLAVLLVGVLRAGPAGLLSPAERRAC